MKILHVTQGYAPAMGGTERVIQRISEELVRQYGDEVTVFTTDRYSGEAFSRPWLPRMATGWEEQAGVKIRRFRVWSELGRMLYWPQAVAFLFRLPFNDYLRTWYQGPLIPSLTREIRRQPADVIAASSFPLVHMFQSLKAARQSARPCILIGGLHPQDTWGYNRPMIYQAIRRASGYVAYTDFEAQYVQGQGAPPGRVAAIGAGVDPAPFLAANPAEAKNLLGLTDQPVVGFIGQLGGHKGVDTLLDAMPLVWEVFPEARLLIAGARTVFATQIEAALAGRLASHRDKVILRYNFTEAERPLLYGAVDVFAYPSGYESFGIAFLEAWAAGKPVIGCRRGAVPWVVSGGRDGLLVPYQAHQALSGAILTLLGNPALAHAMGESGRRKVLTRYTWAEIARRFREVYQTAIAERRMVI